MGVDNSVESKRVSRAVNTVDLGKPLWVSVGVETERAVNEGMVEPEEWVANGGLDIGHDSSDTVVTISVVTKLSASSQTGVVGVAGAEIEIFLVAVACKTALTVTGQAMNRVAVAGADVENQVGKLLPNLISYLFEYMILFFNLHRPLRTVH